jgi:hypothetical protein
MRGYFDSQNITLFSLVLYAFIAGLIYLFLPRFLAGHGKRRPGSQPTLMLAASLFFLSVLLPSPLIHGKNTNFTTHFVGGGIFTGLIWLYLKRNLNWRAGWRLEITSLYFLVCGLGVANELMEFTLNGLGLANVPGTDTWWDLLANTLGAASFWLIYRIWPR